MTDLLAGATMSAVNWSEVVQKALARRVDAGDLRKEIAKSVKELDFIQAAKLRDEMFTLEDYLKERQSG